jgi:hypothetical protein
MSGARNASEARNLIGTERRTGARAFGRWSAKQGDTQDQAAQIASAFREMLRPVRERLSESVVSDFAGAMPNPASCPVGRCFLETEGSPTSCLHAFVD